MQILKSALYIITIILTIISFYVLAGLVKKAFFTLTISDFATYYYIPKAVLHLSRPEHPYTNLVPYYPFFYPPQSIPLFGLLSYFPFYLAKYLWTCINLLLAFSSIYIINSFFNKKLGFEFWIMIFAMINFFPFQFTLTDGQFNIIILYIFVLIANLLLHKDYFKLALPLVIGIITKISPLIVLLYLVFKRKYKAIIYTLGFILLFTVIGEILISKGITFYYLRHVIDDVSKQANTPSYMDQSILGFLRRFEFHDLMLGKFIISSNIVRSLVSYSITGVFILLLLGLEYLHKVKSRANFLIIYSALVLVGLIGTGLAWYHQFVVLLLPLYVGFLYTTRLKNNIKYILLGFLLFAYLLMGTNLIGVFKGFAQLTSLLGGLILYFVLVFLIKNKPTVTSYIEFTKSQNIVILIIAIFTFIISINPLTLDEFLKEGRDRVRIRNIDFLGIALSSYKPDFKIGESNSFIRTEKVDEGYILFENAQGDYRQKISLLPLDPINNNEYNYRFKSTSKVDFVLRAKLESNIYLNKFGNFYSFSCSGNKCSIQQDIK